MKLVKVLLILLLLSSCTKDPQDEFIKVETLNDLLPQVKHLFKRKVSMQEEASGYNSRATLYLNLNDLRHSYLRRDTLDNVELRHLAKFQRFFQNHNITYSQIVKEIDANNDLYRNYLELLLSSDFNLMEREGKCKVLMDIKNQLQERCSSLIGFSDILPYSTYFTPEKMALMFTLKCENYEE